MITIRQIKAARALLAWSQADLAKHSGVSEPTVARLESVDGELGEASDSSDDSDAERDVEDGQCVLDLLGPLRSI